MGSCFSIPVSVDDLIRIFRFLSGKGYIRNLKDNLKDLEREMEDLKATQQEVKNRVAREESQHRQRLEAVKVWFTRVEKTHIKFNDLLSISHIHLQELCLCDICSINVCSSYGYGKRVFLLLEEVKILKSESNFYEVAELTPISEIEERNTWPTIGHEVMLEKAWNRLMEDGVGIMGLHGMGGVGKTTLLDKIHNRFAEMDGIFDVVIWVVVSQGVEISTLQDDIAKKLHLCGGEWAKKNETDKAAEIFKKLNGKKFALMLDDIWEKVDLKTIGVPFPTRKNGCKVPFTTRSHEVCGRMGDPEPMEVKCLEWNESWELFKTKVGDNTLRRNPGIVELAKKVAEKCHGLPLALSVIGETMASKTMVQEWKHAIDVLTRSAADFPDMENKILPILKYSFDSLVDEHIKSCFLYCALFPGDFNLEKERLINYWICEGFIGDYQVVKRAMNKGYEILGTLIRSNLLTEVGTNNVVVHDVVREMALWIASYLGEQKDNFVVRGVGLSGIPEVKNWGVVRRMSLIKMNIENTTFCSNASELTTLFLQNNNVKNLSGEFIWCMQKLLVLDLSNNRNLDKLPEQISKLTSLQYLDLSYTSIEKLPVGLQELKNLTHLDLTSTWSLCSLSGISKLSSLRILKLLLSKAHGDVGLLKELQILEHLQVLTIKISTELALEQLLGDQRLANCVDCLQIYDFEQKPFNISLLVDMENLRELEIWYVSEIYTDMASEMDTSVIHNPTSLCFTNLSYVRICNCRSTEDLMWLLFAKNLLYLAIFKSNVEEIISKERLTNLTGVAPFQKLQVITLVNLPKLKSVYPSPLPFPFLRCINVEDCPKLRKLPLNATSVPQVGDFWMTMRPPEQITDLEWEDEDTKNRLLPLFF